MIEQLAPVLVLVAVVAVFSAAMIGLTYMAGPKRNPSPDKQLPYECGVRDDETQTTKFPVKFYLTAILFILFDIEVIFLYPWALVFDDFLKHGAFIFVEMMVF